jgi:hypothetical protein
MGPPLSTLIVPDAHHNVEDPLNGDSPHVLDSLQLRPRVGLQTHPQDEHDHLLPHPLHCG